METLREYHKKLLKVQNYVTNKECLLMCSSVGCIVYRQGKNQWAQGYNNKHFSKQNAMGKKNGKD